MEARQGAGVLGKDGGQGRTDWGTFWNLTITPLLPVKSSGETNVTTRLQNFQSWKAPVKSLLK